MNPSGGPSPARSTAVYAEDRCALRWPLLTAAVYAPVAVLAFAAASIASAQDALSWAAVSLLGVTAAVWGLIGAWLPYVWPAGIRLDQHGIRIGGVRWADRHPGRARTRTATVPRQYSQVFGCPWAGVREIGVSTSRPAIKIMLKYAYRGRKLTPLGNLATPFMRAALVIVVDTAQAQLPPIRPTRSPLWGVYTSPGFHQPVWVVPTRHPDRLRAALAALPLPPGTIADPPLQAATETAVLEWSTAQPE